MGGSRGLILFLSAGLAEAALRELQMLGPEKEGGHVLLLKFMLLLGSGVILTL